MSAPDSLPSPAHVPPVAGRSDPLAGAGIEVACAWCSPGDTREGVSHGICERHAAELLADEWGQGVLAEIEGGMGGDE